MLFRRSPQHSCSTALIECVQPQRLVLAGFGSTTSTAASPSSSSLVPSSTTNSSSSSSSNLLLLPQVGGCLVSSQRFLRVAKSPHGYYIRRRGQFANHWPRNRRPFYSNGNSAKLQPLHHWRQFGPHNPDLFLPKDNYVTGPWNGLFVLGLHQVYTLHHCTANVPIRVKRMPTTYEFKNHSRWMIGKAMRTWVEPKAHIFDEVALTKKARLTLVKKGLLPPG